MKAILCRELSGYADLTCEEVPKPEPGPDQIRFKVAAAGVNFPDILLAAGQYQERPELPFTPGVEAAGLIDAVGADIEDFAIGDRVCAFLGHGAYAEYALAGTHQVFRVPDNLTLTKAAAFPVVYTTAHHGLKRRSRLAVGETLLVLGAAGGVGTAAVGLGKALGATVIGAARGDDKRAFVEANGADHVFDYTETDIREHIRALTGDKGVDVVFDPVGGDGFDAALRSLAWEGRIVIVGFAGGRISEIPANYLLVKNISAIGLNGGAHVYRAPATLGEAMDDLLAMVAAGTLSPPEPEGFALADTV